MAQISLTHSDSDPWWNVGMYGFLCHRYAACMLIINSSENQALGRVRRIGQKKETHLAKMVTKGTVDSLMISSKSKSLNGFCNVN